MIIEVTKTIYQPRRTVDVGYEVSISKVDDDVFKFDDFDEWLSYKVAELGTGNHSIHYLDPDPNNEDYLVEFTVVLTNISTGEWFKPLSREDIKL